MFLRVWTCMLFASVWLSVQPRQSVTEIPTGWEWQLPLYAAIPVVLTFEDADKTISLCVVWIRLCIVILGCMLSLVLTSVIWAAKDSSVAQGVILCVIQPVLSVFFSAAYNYSNNWKKHIQFSHLIEILVTFQSYTYGATFSNEYHAWKLPVYVFISYFIGLIFIYMSVLFIAPRWECVLCSGDLEEGEGKKETDGEKKNTDGEKKNIDGGEKKDVSQMPAKQPFIRWNPGPKTGKEISSSDESQENLDSPVVSDSEPEVHVDLRNNIPSIPVSTQIHASNLNSNIKRHSASSREKRIRAMKR